MIPTYIAYADKDESLKDELSKHLNSLARRGLISLSDRRSVPPGSNWETHIVQAIESAKLILLLCSPDFFNSDWSYEYELKRAVQQQKSQQSIVVPVLGRPCNLDDLETLTRNQWLPRNGKPVTQWQDQDEAWLKVCQEINEVVQLILTQVE